MLVSHARLGCGIFLARHMPSQVLFRALLYALTRRQSSRRRTPKTPAPQQT